MASGLLDSRGNLSIPAAEPNGFVRTLNSMGYMLSGLDAFSRAFVDFAPNAPGTILEIGAAYGVVTLELLQRGFAVTANDIDPRHLEILASRTSEAGRARLTLLPGSFPDELRLGPGTVGAMLVARVLHFFDGATVDRAFVRISEWLAPGGKAIITAETPYRATIQEWIPIYEAKRKAGAPWPGLIEDMSQLKNPRKVDLPKLMNCLDPDVLTRSARKAGLEVDTASFFGRPEFPPDVQLDGRESVGLIVVKPRKGYE